MTEVLPPLALCLVWCTSHAAAGWSHRPAHWQCWSRRITALRIPAGMRLAVADVQRQARPAQPRPELPTAQERCQPAGAGQQVDRLADDGLLERLPGRGRCPGRAWLPWRRRQSSSTHSRTRSSRASALTSPVTIGAIAASQAMASAASPSSHAPPSLPVSAAAARCAAQAARTCAVHSSCRAEPPSSRSRSASEMCAQTLTGCPARSGSRSLAASRASPPAGHRGTAAPGSGHPPPRPAPTAPPAPRPPPPHTPGSGPRSGRPRPGRWSPAARRGPRTRAPGPRPAGRRGPARTSRRPARPDPAAPARPAAAAMSRISSDVGPVLLRQLVGPLADRPPIGLRQILGGQRRHHPRVRGGPLRPRGVCGRGAATDPRLVDQPGPRAVIGIRAIPLGRR